MSCINYKAPDVKLSDIEQLNTLSHCQIVKPGLTFHKCDSEHKMSNRDRRPDRKGDTQTALRHADTHTHTSTHTHTLITTLVCGNICTSIECTWAQ